MVSRTVDVSSVCEAVVVPSVVGGKVVREVVGVEEVEEGDEDVDEVEGGVDAAHLLVVGAKLRGR